MRVSDTMKVFGISLASAKFLSVGNGRLNSCLMTLLSWNAYMAQMSLGAEVVNTPVYSTCENICRNVLCVLWTMSFARPRAFIDGKGHQWQGRFIFRSISYSST